MEQTNARPHLTSRLTTKSRFYLLLALLIWAAGCVAPLPTVVPITPATGETPTVPPVDGDPATGAPGSIELLGMVAWPTNTTILDTQLGGLSALAYDANVDVYYALSDDRGLRGTPRIYQLRVDLADGLLQPDDVTWEAVIPLRTGGGDVFSPNSIDPEGLAYAGDRFWVSSEGNGAMEPPLPPAIFGLTPTGDFLTSLPVPEKYLPARDGHRGVRNNRAFEGLALTPDGQHLVVAVENALRQDGPTATLEQASPTRWLWLDAATGQPVREVVYVVEPLPFAPLFEGGQRNNGLSDLVALGSEGRFLAVERGFAVGRGNSIRLYWVDTAGATDVLAVDPLPQPLGEIQPATKTLAVDLATLGFAPDNVEGMTLGPRLEDGRQVLLLVSDNNFSHAQVTQLIALALTPGEAPVGASD